MTVADAMLTLDAIGVTGVITVGATLFIAALVYRRFRR